MSSEAVTEKLENWFARTPVVAILRGVSPQEILAVGEALVNAEIGIIEIPLNSPEPYESIRLLNQALGDRCVIGAGTVVTLEQAEAVAEAGGTIAVSPNTNPAIIRRSIELGMIPMPGWATPTEAFEAYHAGARYLKLFPAVTYGPAHIKASSAVIPGECKLMAVGGVGADVAQSWLQAGVDGFGIGSELYKPGDSAEKVAAAAVKVVAAVRAAQGE